MENKATYYSEKEVSPFIPLKPFKIDPLFFATEISDIQKKTLFEENVETVLIELSSRSNHSASDKHSENTQMPQSTLKSILNELSSIDYSGCIVLSYFDEPQVSIDLNPYIDTIKTVLSNCRIYIAKNGDLYKHIEKQNGFCYIPFITLSIDYMGNAFECPYFHNDVDKHKKYLLGNVSEKSIFEIYAGKKATDLRREYCCDTSSGSHKICI